MKFRRLVSKLVRLIASLTLGLLMVCGLLILYSGLLSTAAAAPQAAPSTAPLSLKIITDPITEDMVLNPVDNPHIVTGATAVISGATLTINPGVEIRFLPGAVLQFSDGAALQALGAPGNLITFTSDVNCSTSTATTDYWNGIRFENDAVDSTIQNALIECTQVGLELNNNANFNILSNTIRFIDDAGLIGTPDGAQIINNVIHDARYGIRINEADNNLVSGNQIYDISMDCIFVEHTPAGLNGGNGNQFVDNQIHDCGDNGIYFDNGTDNVFQDNEIYDNSGFGIYLTSGTDNSVLENEVYRNGTGLGFDNQTKTVTNDFLVQDNDVYSNTGVGLLITDTEAILLSQNLILDNQQGVLWGLANDSDPNLEYDLVGNVICRNSQYQFRHSDPAPAFTPLAVTPDWWGTNTPTIGAISSGEEIEQAAAGAVDIDPWMVLTATTPVNTLPADGVSTTTITIDLSGGGTTVPARARDITVAPASNVSPQMITLDNNGQGSVVYTAGVTLGPVVITVTDLCAAHQLTLDLTLAETDLAVDKTSTVTQVSLGQNITYTIAYTNTGGVATMVRLTDTLPSGTVWVTDTATSLGFSRVQTSPQVIWTHPSLGQNVSDTITLVAQVPAGSIGSCGQTLINEVEITSATTDTNPSNNSAIHSGGVAVNCPNLLAITKTLQSTAPSLGKVTTFTLSYKNLGTVTATNAVISDFLAADVVYITDTLGIASAVTTTNLVTWNIGDLGPGQSNSFDVGLRLDATPAQCVGGTISFTNTASLASASAVANSGVINSGNISCDTVDLVVIKNDGVGTGDPIAVVAGGGLITYTISVNNLGGAAANNVILTETLPDYTSFVGPVGGNGWFGPGPGNTYTYSVGTLPAMTGGIISGQVVTFVVRVDPNLSCTIDEVVNTVSAASDGPEADPTDNIVNEQTPVTCNPLELSKSTPAVCALPGQLVDYTITVTNNNTSPVNNLLLTEFLPSHTSFQGPAGTWNVAGPNTFTHTISTINGGQTNQTGFWVQVDPATPPAVTAITNVVTLEPSGLSFTLTTPIEHNAPDLYVIKNDNIELLSATQQKISRIEQKVGRVPWLDAVKQASLGVQATSASPGDVISYTIGFGNAGTTTATNVVITETLPANTTFVGPLYWTHLGGSTYVYTLTTLAAGDGGNLDFRVRIDNPFPANTIGVTNTIQIGSAALFECDLSDNLNAEFTRVDGLSGPFFMYLPLVMKNYLFTQPPPPPPPPPVAPLLGWVSDVAVDQTTNQVFIASPRENVVHTIDGAGDTYTNEVPVGNGPSGLAVLTSTTPSKVFVAHASALNNWAPGIWIIDSDDLGVRAMSHENGYVGAAPVKLASNSNAGWERIYVSNYFDRLPILYGPAETRIGWVPKKSFQASYGVEVSQRTDLAYLSAIDTGELIIFDGTQGETVSDYGACHHAPPEARILRMVAVDQATGHVFVASPPDTNTGQTSSKVFVMDEDVLLQATGGPPSDLTCTWNFARREDPLTIQAIPGPAWVKTITLSGAVSAGEEGIAVNPLTHQVYITDGPTDKLFVIDYDPSSNTVNDIITVTVGDNPQGVDVNPLTNKIYVANARHQNAPYGTVTVVNGVSNTVIKTIPLTP